MGNLLIGGRNLISRSATTLTPGAEVAGFDADNLKIEHPSEFWRTGDLTSAGAYVDVDLGASVAYDLVAALYHTGTPHRNLLRNSTDLTVADWTATNGTLVAAAGQPPVDSPWAAIQKLSATGTGVHTLHHEFTFIKDMEVDTDNYFAVSCYIKRSGGGHAQIRLQGSNPGDNSYINCDLDSNTIQPGSPYDNGLWGGTAAAVAAANGGFYRFSFRVAAPGAANDTVRMSVYALDSSFTESYTAGSEGLIVSLPQVSVGSFAATASPGLPDSNLGERGATWDIWTSDVSNFLSANKLGMFSLAPSDRSREAGDDIGTLHAWRHFSSPYFNRYIRVYFDDEDNADSRLDLGNLFVGRVFQPTRNIQPASLSRSWDEDTDPDQRYAPRGEKFRRWSLALHYLTRAEAEGELEDILRHVGRSRMALFILDPDEATYGQNHILYGRITRSDVMHAGYSAKDGEFYKLRLSIREVVPD